MPIVSFVLRNKVYNIACDDGEEERIKKLADSLNNRLNEMSKNFGSASDNVILAFTAITMEDEIFSMKNAKITHESLEKTPSADQQVAINNAIADTMEPITKYIEELAHLIKKV
jgi:cell division protein ZapA